MRGERELISSEVRYPGGACKVVTFVLSDRTNSVNCKEPLGATGKDDPARPETARKLEPGLKRSWLKVRG